MEKFLLIVCALVFSLALCFLFFGVPIYFILKIALSWGWISIKAYHWGLILGTLFVLFVPKKVDINFGED